MVERLSGWLLAFVQRIWVTALLLGLVVTMLVASFQRANWVRDEQALSNAFLVGLLFGLLLAISRFRGWLAGPYALVMAFVVGVESVGRVLPAPGPLLAEPAVEILERMHLRVWNVVLRMGGWIETLRAGENVQDPGLFVLLLSALLMLCGVWLMWSLVRGRNALLGLLPVGMLYAVNMHLSRQPLSHFMLFLLGALLLIARSEFNRQHEEWDRRNVDYPDQLGLEWAAAAVAFAVAVALIARAAPLVGTPEGWQVISEWASRANDQTAETATRLFSGVNPPPPDPDEEPVIFINTPNLGSIGTPISQGQQTVMWVSTSDPPPISRDMMGASLPAEYIRIHYWRNGIYGAYTGRGWEPVELGMPFGSQEDITPGSAPDGRYYLRQNYTLEARHAGTLFSVSDPVQASRGVYLREAGAGEGTLIEGQPAEYSVISAATRVSATQLARAAVDYPPEVRNRYLQVPDALPQRVRQLTGRVVAGANNQYERALRVQNYLRENYEYDLTAGPAPEGRDVVDYFLFEEPRGFCSHYASAMVVMLRSVGVPARIVTGYAMGDFDPIRQAFRVPESASHAWVEVYFPAYGWVEFEPTAARSVIVYAEEAPIDESPAAPVALDPEPEAASAYLAALALVGMLALVALPFVLLQLFNNARRPPTIQVDALYHQMRRALGWAGLVAVSSVTPDEYLRLTHERLAPYAQVQQALRQTTALYRESLYSPRPPDPERVRSASQLWRRSLRQWATLLARTAWAQLRARLTE